MAETIGALDARDALRRGEVSARELALDALERIDAHRGLGAFISVDPELALREADAADRRISASRERGRLPPLLGVPTAHKDLVDVRGAVTTHGSAAVPHARATRDAPVAAAVRAAGAVSLGKTQVSEFGIAGYSENEIAPPARNPHDPERTAGGSSGGSAAAVAAGLLPGAIGSDGGGSIRIPAAACGLIGLKPGRGTVPADAVRRAGAGTGAGLDPLGAPSLAVSGPLARSALDAALLYDALLGRDDEPALRAVRDTVARPEELRGLRIGVSAASPFADWATIRFDTGALDALDTGAAALDAAGHELETAEFAYDPRYPESFTTVWSAGLGRIGLDPEAEERLGALAAMFLRRARRASADALAASARVLRRFAVDAARDWGRYDAVLTPALAFTAPRIGAFRALDPEGDYRLQCEWAPQTSMVNVAGLPAITVPTLTDPAGRPAGVQLIGRPGSEVLLLRLAAQLTDRLSA